MVFGAGQFPTWTFARLLAHIIPEEDFLKTGPPSDADLGGLLNKPRLSVTPPNHSQGTETATTGAVVDHYQSTEVAGAAVCHACIFKGTELLRWRLPRRDRYLLWCQGSVRRSRPLACALRWCEQIQ